MFAIKLSKAQISVILFLHDKWVLYHNTVPPIYDWAARCHLHKAEKDRILSKSIKFSTFYVLYKRKLIQKIRQMGLVDIYGLSDEGKRIATEMFK